MDFNVAQMYKRVFGSRGMMREVMPVIAVTTGPTQLSARKKGQGAYVSKAASQVQIHGLEKWLEV